MAGTQFPYFEAGHGLPLIMKGAQHPKSDQKIIQKTPPPERNFHESDYKIRFCRHRRQAERREILLLNALLGEKIAIVSSKPQTTRTRILGVLTDGDTQFCFLDTPGFHKPKTKLSGHMNKVVESSIGEVDLILFLVERKGS